MADIQTFKGIKYDLRSGQDPALLLCPPYDVISAEEQARLRTSSPYNAVRLELGQELPTDSPSTNRYTRAAELLEAWLRDGVLVQEDTPALYLLREEFTHLGQIRVRRSLLARVRLEEFSSGVVLPHEETSQGPKKDRLELLTATNANLSPILSVYRDPSGDVPALMERSMAHAPLLDTKLGASRIQLWALTDTEAVETIQGRLRDAPIYLADGHHRYETALRYRDIRRAAGTGEGGHDFVLMALTEIRDPGLLVLPYHRLLKGLSRGELERMVGLAGESFVAQPVEDNVPQLAARLEAMGGDQVALGLLDYGAKKASLLTLKGGPADSSSVEGRFANWVLGSGVLEPVLGTQEAAVERGVLSFNADVGAVPPLDGDGDLQLAFLLPPVPLDLFEEVVLSGERLPLKSTYFSPKLPTGLVINRLV